MDTLERSMTSQDWCIIFSGFWMKVSQPQCPHNNSNGQMQTFAPTSSGSMQIVQPLPREGPKGAAIFTTWTPGCHGEVFDTSVCCGHALCSQDWEDPQEFLVWAKQDWATNLQSWQALPSNWSLPVYLWYILYSNKMCSLDILALNVLLCTCIPFPSNFLCCFVSKQSLCIVLFFQIWHTCP
jgi:hypothetical protein